jgi:hypothetical protein
MTTIFTHKGVIGIQSDPDSDALIAKPENGSLGCVCHATKIKISKEALDLLKTIPRGHDSLGEINVFKDSEGNVIFGWFGGYLKAFVPSDIETSRDYDPSLLTHSDGVETPKSFIEFIDENF